MQIRMTKRDQAPSSSKNSEHGITSTGRAKCVACAIWKAHQVLPANEAENCKKKVNRPLCPDQDARRKHLLHSCYSLMLLGPLSCGYRHNTRPESGSVSLKLPCAPGQTEIWEEFRIVSPEAQEGLFGFCWGDVIGLELVG